MRTGLEKVKLCDGRGDICYGANGTERRRRKEKRVGVSVTKSAIEAGERMQTITAQMLKEPEQRMTAMLALHPSADAQRGDGELLGAIAKVATRRAERTAPPRARAAARRAARMSRPRA